MRIAVLTEVFVPKIDGITNRLRNTLECFDELGHEVLVIAPDNAAAEHPHARVVRVPSVGFRLYPAVRAALPAWRIGRELARFEPDVVHAVGPACLGVWGTMAARALRLPLLSSYHTDFPRYAKAYGLGEICARTVWALTKWVHNAAVLNLCPSRFTARELREHGVHDVSIWRGGVDVGLFHPSRRSEEMRRRLCGGAPDRPLLLYAGRIAEEKNLGVFEEILAARPDVRVALVGDGPARSALAERLDPQRVVFTGFLRGEELASAFACADAFVMPSTTETLGFVVLEAMASGCPVVAANAGGVPDLVTHGETGLLYDPSEEGAAARAVSQLLERAPDSMRALGQKGRARAEASSWMAETEGLVENYRQAITLHRRRRDAPRTATPRTRRRVPASRTRPADAKA